MRAGSPALTQVHIRTLVIYHIIYKNASVFLKCKTQSAKCKIGNGLIHPAVAVKISKRIAKPFPLFCLAKRRGQGARPRPVGDAGSVSWRSGQNCAK